MSARVRILIMFFPIVFVSCHETSQYPFALNKAIDYFYIENKNDSVLLMLQVPSLKKQSKDIQDICQVFSAAAYCEQGKVDTARLIFHRVLPNYSNKELMNWYKSIEGLILFRENQLTKSYQVLTSMSEGKYMDKRALALNERLIARILFSLSESDQAIEYIVSSNQHFKECNLIKGVAINEKLMGRHYMQIGNFPQALKSFQFGEKTFQNCNDKIELFYIYVNLIDYYIADKDLTKASFYADKCITEYKGVADNQMQSIISNNLGEIYFLQNKYDQAKKCYEKTLTLSNDYSTAHIRKIHAHVQLSKINLILKDTEKARFHALEAQKIGEGIKGDKITQSMIYQRLAESFKGSYPDTSYVYMNKALTSIDSAYYNIAKTSKAFFDAKSDLLNSMCQLKKMEEGVKTRHLITWLIIIASILTSFIFFIIYYLQRSKNNILRELVRKNLQIIDDERKMKELSLKQHGENRKARKNTDSEKSDVLFNYFVEWLEKDKNYRRKDLTVEVVAKELKTNREYLSRAINDNNFRFNEIINRRRINEAIRILSDQNNVMSRYNLSVIAFESGFQSVSVFIDAFKKQTGMTPAEFRGNLQK